MTQIHKKPPISQHDLSPSQKFQRKKLPAEDKMTSCPKDDDALATVIRNIQVLPNDSGSGSPYLAAISRGAKIAKGLDGPVFRDTVFTFSDTPSIMAVLSLCSLLPEKNEARAYSARMLYDRNDAVRVRASSSIVEGFFVSDVLLPAIEKRVGTDALGIVPLLQSHYCSLVERYGALRRSAFVAMADFYELDATQFGIVKASSGGLFARKFEEFYRENRGWNWIYDKSV